MKSRLAAFCLLLLTAGCPKPEAPHPKASSAPEPPAGFARSASAEPARLGPGERWNLLLVTMDTVRADCLKELGAPRTVAPNVEQLASEGVLLTHADTVTPLTLPAHCSILTGLYPGTHGVRHNARYALKPEHRTIASVLRDAGYQTGAFVAAFPLSPEYGTSQGFDTYDASFERTRGVDSDRPASAVNAVALPWLQQRQAGTPFFCWIHYFDAHDPYEPPEPYRSRYPESPYLGEVATADAALGQVLTALQARGLLEHTLVVVSADHGEGLGEHGEPFHGLLLHDSTVHVPIVFWGGPLRRERRTLDFPASVVDLAPTALALLGVAAPPETQGLNLSKEMLGADEKPPREGAFSETYYGFLEFGWSPLRGVSDGRWRYVDSPAPELYDDRDDPKELTDLAAKRTDEAARLAASLKRLAAAASTAGASASAEHAISEQEMEALQSLGYVSGGAGGDVESAPAGPDPKAMIGLYSKYNDARARLDGGDPQGALAILDEIVPKDPKNLQFRGKRAKALAYMGRFDEAEAEWRSMIAQDPHYVHAYWDLATLFDLSGRERKALAVLADMEKADASYVGLTERVAELQAVLGDLSAAKMLATKDATPEDRALASRLALEGGDAKLAASILAGGPSDAEGWRVAATKAEAEGRAADALAALKAEAAAHPREIAVLHALCSASLRLDAKDLAAESCTALTSLPGHAPRDQALLVQALVRAGRDDEAKQRSAGLLQGNPGWWWVHRAWAEELERRGDHAGAKASYQAWLALDPGSAEAKAGLARVSG